MRALAGRRSITVTVKLYATLRAYRPGLGVGEPFSVSLPERATVAQLLEALRVPADQVKIVFVNNLVRREDYVLSDGDQVGIFPPVGGG